VRRAVQTFLMCAINYALAAPADFQQFVIPKVGECSCRPRSFLVRRCRRLTIVGAVNDAGYRFANEQT